jgi:hypothetical protein
MKIASEKQQVYHSIDVIQKLKELEEQYRSIYWTHIEGDLYIYKPIGRKDYREIVGSEMSIEDKKDELIKKCILFPEDFDIDDMVAGMIDVLFEKIIDISYLDSEESRAGVIEYYRQEMYNLDNQITCIINEAFPQFDIEDIENWDVEKTAKYLSRAEWKLQNFRGFQFNEEYFDYGQASSQVEQEEVQEQQVNTNEDENKPTKEKLTPEKLRQLKAQFPEIDWENDAIMRGGVDAMADSVDTMAPALRPGW